MSLAQACPHCGSGNHRHLADHQGSVYWCGECHRTWIPAWRRRAATFARLHPVGRRQRIRLRPAQALR